MLFGEHAVLHGKTAIVAAVDNRLKVYLTPTNSNKIFIKSNLEDLELNLNNLSQELTDIIPNSKINFILECINYFQQQDAIKSGFNLEVVDHNLPKEIGFGSSAAIVVGVVAVINKFLSSGDFVELSKQSAKEVVFQQSLAVVKKVQNGLGSGGDVLASLYGGVIAYQNYLPKKILAQKLDLTAIYSGYKTKTATVIQLLNNKITEDKYYQDLYNYIFNSIDQCSTLALTYLENKNFTMLGQVMNVAHGLMSGLGVVDNNLDSLAVQLRGIPNICGAKISGAGMGDCVVGLGKTVQEIPDYQNFTLQTAREGLLWL
jgi:mevalonate kinase